MNDRFIDIDGQLKNGYYKSLSKLIEETYSINNNTPVTIIAHSMGGPITHYFLAHYVQDDWKDKYIQQYVSLSGVYGGTVKALKALISGDVEEVYTANVDHLRDFGRSLPGLMSLLPSTEVWGQNEVIVTTAMRNYTVGDVMELFNDLNYTNGIQMYSELRNISNDFKPPNVTHYCFYGSGVKTLERIHYREDFAEMTKEPDYGDGDGTVNIRSLLSCNNWNGQYHSVHLKSFEKVTHVEMIRDKNVLNEIKEIIN